MTTPKTSFTAWSYSRWHDWYLCPRKAKYKFLDGRKEPPNQAMERGSQIHKDAEQYIVGNKTTNPFEEFGTFKRELDKLKKRPDVVAEAQWTFTEDWTPTGWRDDDAWLRMGIDAHFPLPKTKELVIVDFKTQKVKGGKPRIYPEWAYQLAAYRHALNNDAEPLQCINVVIDSETGEIWEHTWEAAAIDKGFTVFRNAFDLWMSVKGYCPYAAKPTSIQNGYILVEDAPLTNTLRGPMTWAEVDMAIETVTQHPPPPPPQTTVEMRQLMDDFSRETRRAVANMVAIQSTPPEPPF